MLMNTSTRPLVLREVTRNRSKELGLRYLHAMVRVKDLAASLRFYNLGLGLIEVRRVDNSKGRFTLVYLSASMDLDGLGQVALTHHQAPLLELTYNWPDADGNTETYAGGRNFGHLAFEVDDIYGLCQHLVDLGYVISRPPRDGHMAFVRSPDDISVELLQKGDAKLPQEPWLSLPNSGVW